MVKDWRGNEIKVGSRIIYAVKGSTSITIHEAEVLEILQKVRYSWDPAVKYDVLKVRRMRGSATYGRDQYKATLTNLNNVTVIKE